MYSTCAHVWGACYSVPSSRGTLSGGGPARGSRDACCPWQGTDGDRRAGGGYRVSGSELRRVRTSARCRRAWASAASPRGVLNVMYLYNVGFQFNAWWGVIKVTHLPRTERNNTDRRRQLQHQQKISRRHSSTREHSQSYTIRTSKSMSRDRRSAQSPSCGPPSLSVCALRSFSTPRVVTQRSYNSYSRRPRLVSHMYRYVWPSISGGCALSSRTVSRARS